jgi:hypothetical protein
MNAKTRVLSILAAVIIPLSMFGGASAQTFDSEPVNAELVDFGGDICTINLLEASGSFGVWQRVGGQYELMHNSSSFIWFISEISGGELASCHVGVNFGGLLLDDGVEYPRIDPSEDHFTLSYDMQEVNPVGFQTTLAGPYPVLLGFQYHLHTVPAEVPPGLYVGEIYVTVANAI